MDLAVYYIRSLSSVLRWAPEAAWTVLAKKLVQSGSCDPPLSEISKTLFTHILVAVRYI